VRAGLLDGSVTACIKASNGGGSCVVVVRQERSREDTERTG
jgi:hypothetical protein